MTPAPILHESRRTHRLRIAAASAFVLATYGASALALIQYRPAESSMEDRGAIEAIEFDELPVAPDTETADSTPAPEMESVAPAPEVQEKLAAKQENDLPTAEASPYEAPPDLQLAQEKTLKKQEEPEEGQPTEAMDRRPPEDAAAAAAASEAAAPTTMDTAERAAAPAEGSVADSQALPQGWQRAIMAHLGRNKRYPAEARTKHVEGEVQLQFVVDRAGRVLASSVKRSSGAAALDREALDMLVRAAPLPPLPSQVRGDKVELIVPIKYRLK